MGGAAHSFHEIAQAQAVLNQGIVPDVVIGSSGGAFNAALYSCAGIDVAKIYWDSIEGTGDVLGWHWNKTEAWYNLNPTKERLMGVIKDFNRCDVIVTVTDAWTKKLIYATPKEPVPGLTFIESIIASGSIPAAIVGQGEGGRYQDGGLSENLPLKHLIDLGCDHIFCFVTECWPPLYSTVSKFGFPKIATAAIAAVQTLIYRNFVNDLGICMQKNTMQSLGYREIEIVVMSPMTPFKTDVLDFSPKALRDIYNTTIQRTINR